jgi:hypothetical protein
MARHLPAIGLALAAVASAALMLGHDSHLTFIADDWDLLLNRQGWSADAILAPFHENIVAGQAVLYKLLLAVFGMGSALPYYVVSIGLFATSGVLLFVYLRRRVGDWAALIAAVLVLFLGAAFEDLLWAFQMGYFAATAAGLGMLVALDREDDRGDAIACALLAVALAFSSLGLAFAAGAFVEVALGRRPRARRLWIGLLSISLFALWWVGWGHSAESHLSLHNLEHLPGYVFDAAGAGFTSLFGLATGDGSEPDQPHLIWGKLAALALFAAVVWRIVREGRLSRGLAVALAIGFAFWILAGLNHTVERRPASSRYQFPSAVFLLLIAGETLRGLRIPRLALVAASLASVAVLIGGISLLDREYRERWQPVGDSIRSSLAAVDIAGPVADPGFPVVFPPSIEVSARTYLAAADEHGTPAFDEAELEGRAQAEREAADLTMAQALGLALVSPERGERALQCEAVRAEGDGYTGVTLLHGGFSLANRSSGPVEVSLGRFAEGFSAQFGELGAGGVTSISIPVDESPRPWNLGLIGAGSIRLCTTEKPVAG